MEHLPFVLLLLTTDFNTDPPLRDLDRFPPVEIAVSCKEFNVAYCNHLKANYPIRTEHYDDWREAYAEAFRLYQAWDYLAAAHGVEGQNELYWRLCLRVLKEIIGDRAYYAGDMPPCVPYHIFTPIYGPIAPYSPAPRLDDYFLSGLPRSHRLNRLATHGSFLTDGLWRRGQCNRTRTQIFHQGLHTGFLPHRTMPHPFFQFVDRVGERFVVDRVGEGCVLADFHEIVTVHQLNVVGRVFAIQQGENEAEGRIQNLVPQGSQIGRGDDAGFFIVHPPRPLRGGLNVFQTFIEEVNGDPLQAEQIASPALVALAGVLGEIVIANTHHRRGIGMGIGGTGRRAAPMTRKETYIVC